MDWSTYIQQLGQQYTTAALTPTPAATPVSTGQGGVQYVEGKPVVSIPAMLTNPIVVVGGVLALGLVAYFVMKK